jgi:hypothetical protein
MSARSFVHFSCALTGEKADAALLLLGHRVRVCCLGIPQIAMTTETAKPKHCACNIMVE